MIYTVWIRINFGITVIEESPIIRLRAREMKSNTDIHSYH